MTKMTNFIDPERDAVPPGHSRRVPLVTVRDLDEQPVAEVDVTFLDSHHGGGEWAVVVSSRADDDNLLVLYGGFATFDEADAWGGKNVHHPGNHWTVAPLGRPGHGQEVDETRAAPANSDPTRPVDGRAEMPFYDTARVGELPDGVLGVMVATTGKGACPEIEVFAYASRREGGLVVVKDGTRTLIRGFDTLVVATATFHAIRGGVVAPIPFQRASRPVEERESASGDR